MFGAVNEHEIWTPMLWLLCQSMMVSQNEKLASKKSSPEPLIVERRVKGCSGAMSRFVSDPVSSIERPNPTGIREYSLPLVETRKRWVRLLGL